MKKLPIYALILLGISISLLYDRKIANLPEVSNPDYIVMDNIQLLIADTTKQLHVYSTKNFKYERQLLKRGEGPGEALGTAFVWTSPNYIYLYCLGKNLFFARDGKFIKEFRTPSNRTTYVRPVDDKFICLNRKINDKTSGSLYDISLYSYSPPNDMKFEKLLYCYEIPKITTKGNKKPFRTIIDRRDVIIFENRIFIGDSERGLFVQVHDLNGNRLYQIRLDSEKIKVPQDYGKDLKKETGDNPKWNWFNNEYYYNQPEYFPGFYGFFIGKNKIYFLTYKKVDNNREVIICDWNGKSVRKKYIPWIDFQLYRIYTIWNDKFYWLVENEDIEEWELHESELK